MSSHDSFNLNLSRKNYALEIMGEQKAESTLKYYQI